jgi:hypothetical protein
MKYIKKFNESFEDKIYDQFLNTISDCFLEFEDNGWYWCGLMNSDSISIPGYNNPHFNCIMKEPKNSYTYEPPEIRDYIDWTGEIKSDGEIKWDTKELQGYNSMIERRDDIIRGSIKEEAENFLVAVKRINSESGLDFRFSYNNRGGEKRIVIQGRI